MAEIRSEKVHRLQVVGRRLISWLLVMMLSCGCIGACFLCLFFYDDIRADFVAARAERRVELIYKRTREAVPDDTTLIREEKPHSGTYSWGLSDGSPQYASVRAQQTYIAPAAFDDVLAFYKDTFSKWRWDILPLDDDAGLLSVVFRHPDDENSLVGLCSPVDDLRLTGPIQYIVFFDFDETSGCEGTRLYCIAVRYCK